jgi:hypothetical protein
MLSPFSWRRCAPCTNLSSTASAMVLADAMLDNAALKDLLGKKW